MEGPREFNLQVEHLTLKTLKPSHGFAMPSLCWFPKSHQLQISGQWQKGCTLASRGALAGSSWREGREDGGGAGQAAGLWSEEQKTSS